MGNRLFKYFTADAREAIATEENAPRHQEQHNSLTPSAQLDSLIHKERNRRPDAAPNKLHPIELELRKYLLVGKTWWVTDPFTVKDEKGATTLWQVGLYSNYDGSMRLTLSNRDHKAFSARARFELLDKKYELNAASIQAGIHVPISLMPAEEFSVRTRHLKSLGVRAELQVKGVD